LGDVDVLWDHVW